MIKSSPTMEYLSFDPKTKQLTLETCVIPKAKGEEILIKVAYSGICGTDLHILNGSFPAKTDAPFSLGHEFSGTVESVGKEVVGFKVGQRVAVDPNSGCNKCNHCRDGRYHFCDNGGINNTIGIFRDGGWATHVLVPESQVYLVPNDVEMHQAALTEPMSCIAHGWDILSPVNIGHKVLIIGAGIIGLLWACVLHINGLRKTVTVAERLPSRQKQIEKLNLDYKGSSMENLTNEKFDLAIDCSGSAAAMEAAFPLLRRGGCLCVFGVAKPDATMAISPFKMYMNELTIKGVIINPHTFEKGLALVQAMSDHYLDYNKLGIKIYKLSEYKEALEALSKGEVSKAVFKCS
ncbi:Similar to ARD1: D-arabinitol dehydrogenase 1 (Uromyces fabae) [Cotesia congregata]|uniref:Similar to ARD1: D-arabinitol dehydrogenase 1 (Uromyces fabae) n=1 Tax=Cotesia congregata TaxID=51543 RepID=A0A8J2MXJ8_COTCN|nr:Similar to ARD1: D-arabinitol dehydrogenase 1 (Uromyces fabae) [Cotesia congregata]